MMKKIILSTVAVAAISTMTFAGGEVTPADQTIDAFNAKNLFDKVHFKGDLRLRYESIETEGSDLSGDKYRNRYRLRLLSSTDITDNIKFDIGMRSGFGNPTSGNQTFEDNTPLKDYFFESLRFHLMDVVYTQDHSTWKIGRSEYMMYRPIKSQLVWDNDISLDGVNYNYTDDTTMITVGMNQPSYAENTETPDNINLLLAQYVYTTKLDAATLNMGTGIYYYDGVKGSTPIYGEEMGNTFTSGGVYANDYHIVEGFAELKFKDVMGLPLKMAAGVAYNTAVSDNNFGYDIGVQLGDAKAGVGSWEVKYSYTDIQEDAVFGPHSDSDNFGGGTAAKGHAIRTHYSMTKNLDLAGTFFFNTWYASRVNQANASLNEQRDYERVQLDAIIKF
jgi:hypothetical protein